MSNNRIRVPLIPDCSTCILNTLQTLIPLLSNNEQKQFELFSYAYKILSEGFSKRLEPAPLSIRLYQELYNKAGVDDPYLEIKRMSNDAAKKALPIILEHIETLEKYDKLRAAIAAAIVGNVIDFNTAGHEPELQKLSSLFFNILERGFAIDNSKQLWFTINGAPGIVVYLADNAGETYFDIPLLHILHEHGWKITYVVKGKAMANDATREDVEGIEIERISRIADTGAWAHGVPLQWVSDEFIKLIEQADLVISKGQANIETFPEIQENIGVETYYITRAKCPHISEILGAKKGDNVILQRPSTIRRNVPVDNVFIL